MHCRRAEQSQAPKDAGHEYIAPHPSDMHTFMPVCAARFYAEFSGFAGKGKLPPPLVGPALEFLQQHHNQFKFPAPNQMSEFLSLLCPVFVPVSELTASSSSSSSSTNSTARLNFVPSESSH